MNRRESVTAIVGLIAMNAVPSLNSDEPEILVHDKAPDDPAEKLFRYSNDYPEWKVVEFKQIVANDIFRFSSHRNGVYVAYYNWTEQGVRGRRIEDIPVSNG